MKVKFSVVYSDSCHQTQEHTIDDCHDFKGLVEDLEKVVELRRLRVAIMKKSDAAAAVMPPMSAEEAYDDKANDKDWGAHVRVFEYDGAFKCLDCKSEWGALSEAPKEPPAECKPLLCHYCPSKAVYEGWKNSDSGDMAKKRYVCSEHAGLMGTHKI